VNRTTNRPRIDSDRELVLASLRKEVGKTYAQMGAISGAEYADMCRVAIARMAGHCAYLDRAEGAQLEDLAMQQIDAEEQTCA